jgi:hypothetical protein
MSHMEDGAARGAYDGSRNPEEGNAVDRSKRQVGGASSGGIGPAGCKILDLDFGELPFHALG